MISEKSWLFFLLQRFEKEQAINRYDYYLFDGIDKLCSFMWEYKINEIYENSVKNFGLSLEDVEKYAWDVKRKINETLKGSQLIAFYMLFDNDMKKSNPFKDYNEERKAKIKMIFCQIMDKISKFDR